MLNEEQKEDLLFELMTSQTDKYDVSSQTVQTRQDNYDEDVCWQYNIRVNNLEDDLKRCFLTKEEVSQLRTSDFTFKLLDTERQRKEAVEFIKRHEWLGTISQYTTHWFGAYYKDILSGVILMNQPNAFSKILGEDTPNLERLVSRGACISWSPKNLASNFLMWCVKYMVNNTQYRLFTAYSDPSAKELGTIYQACNWYYLGQTFGASRRYYSPYSDKLVSDRAFRCISFYKRYAKELGIIWEKNWQNNQTMLWDNIPDDVEEQLRLMSKTKQEQTEYIIPPMKHKYAYVLGRNKKETKKLKKQMKLVKTYPYPKER